MHEASSFITLTYAPAHLPYDESVNVGHWQTFAKRLRNEYGSFRFFRVLEYGSKTNRPHAHALIWGIDFLSDRKYQGSPKGYPIFTSPTLDRIWGKGRTEIGTLSYATAAYAAQYTQKKSYGQDTLKSLLRHDPLSGCLAPGNCWKVRPTTIGASSNPGLGKSWFLKYHRDVFPEDCVVINGYRKPVPLYYDKLHEKYISKEAHRLVKARRNLKMAGNTPEWATFPAREFIKTQKINATHREPS